MQPAITTAQAAEWDARSATPVTRLMERAGMAVSLGAVQLGASYGKRVVVLVGPGDNGGDGYIAAKYLLRRGVSVEVLVLAEPRSEGCRWARAQAQKARVPIAPWRDPKEGLEPDLVIDAVFGAGFRGELPDQLVPWTNVALPVLSVDVPSGLDGTTGLGKGFKADLTVTFGAYKVGHLIGIGPEVSGTVIVADIGLDPGPIEFRICEEADAPRPGRSRSGHKWSVGSVMVVGGSPGITGALSLAGRSALNAGAGAVQLALPAALEHLVAAPELMTLPLGRTDRLSAGEAAAVLEAAERFDVLVVGPGLGAGQTEFIAVILRGRQGPLVIDADGLNAIEGPAALDARPGPTVITPHAREFERLSGTEPTHRNAADLAHRTRAVVVLKGNPTFVAGEDLWAVTSGGPELATIGTGDVLAGMVAALWARGLDGETAARSGAFWHGRAGAGLRAKGTVTADALAEEVAFWAWSE